MTFFSDFAPRGSGVVRPVGDAGWILRGRFGDDSRTIRGGFEGVWAAEAPSDHAGDPGEGVEPREGRAQPVGTVVGSFGEPGRILRGRFENGSRTIRGGFEGVWAAEAPSDHAVDPGEGADPREG